MREFGGGDGVEGLDAPDYLISLCHEVEREVLCGGVKRIIWIERGLESLTMGLERKRRIINRIIFHSKSWN